MPNPVKMYVSHTWMFHSDACKKKEMFFKQFGISHLYIEPYNNISEDIENKDLIDKNMKRADCVLILAGVKESADEWVLREIESAKKYAVPIIAIEPWTKRETSENIRQNADAIVAWHGKLITDAIKTLTNSR
jgi:hypothetical protein